MKGMEIAEDQPVGEIRAAAASLGRKGGQSKSEAKKKAVRENGRKGGRPKKKKPADLC